ncbi:hypothetical protein LJK88_20085 [Paenibacillus sp. P26]|nr:hypothetical protein LJK88_20085 [Paenibacillus sp. P26]
MSKRRMQTDVLVLGIFTTAGFAVARSFTDMAAAVICGMLLMAVYVKICRVYEPYILRRILSKQLLHERQKIRQGLLSDIARAEEDLKAEDFKAAYEKFREIGFFLKDNPIRLLKIMCLSHFILRHDMELELAELIPDRFEPNFIAYLLEIGRVKPQLIDRSTLDYVQKHRAAIEALPHGREVLAAAAGAALRIKSHLAAYRSLIADYADAPPKDRPLRLERLAAEQAASDPELYARVRELVKRRFGPDAPVSATSDTP